jgi:hypothetical protein
MQLITQAEYARHRGVSPQAVNKMVKSGRIPLTNGRIDPAAADFALGTVRDEPVVTSDAGGLTRARTDTETYRARIAQLDYEQRIGRVVAIDDVTRAMERCAEAMVRDLEQLPARADDLAAAFAGGDIAGLRAALKGLARDMRATLADNMRLLARDADDAGDAADDVEVAA